jgi:hypothetical protein
MPAAEAEPVAEPEHKPEFTVVSEPEPLPDFVIEPPSQPEPVEPPKPEPVAAAAPEPLPDFVVPPGATPDPHAPPLAPEPEPEPDLGPLPDYVVDPNRPPEAMPPAPERHPPPATSEPYFEVPSEPEPPASSSGLYFPPLTSFPAPRDEPDHDPEHKRDAPKAPRRRPAPDPGKSKRGKSGAAEPGDEAEEISWMEGLSNRLSAYSLAEEDVDASSTGEPTTDKPEDAETGT